MDGSQKDEASRKFEFEKYRFEKEIELKSFELERKYSQKTENKWLSPLFLGLVAAVLGLIGNAVVATINGIFERELEATKSENILKLEQQRAEADRILEAIKTGDPDRAAANLELMVQTKLITNGRSEIAAYLRDRTPGEGASLPAPVERNVPQNFGAIVGKDTRETIQNSKEAPFNSVCQVFTDSFSYCTGILIHKRIVLVPSFLLNEENHITRQKSFDLHK